MPASPSYRIRLAPDTWLHYRSKVANMQQRLYEERDGVRYILGYVGGDANEKSVVVSSYRRGCYPRTPGISRFCQ
jgi:hypothetical protein